MHHVYQVPGKVFRVVADPRPVSKDAFKYKLMCVSCTTCRLQVARLRPPGCAPPQRVWNAIVEYNRASRTLTKEWTPVSFHGDAETLPEAGKKRPGVLLTAAARAALEKRLGEPGRITNQDLLNIV